MVKEHLGVFSKNLSSLSFNSETEFVIDLMLEAIGCLAMCALTVINEGISNYCNAFTVNLN